MSDLATTMNLDPRAYLDRIRFPAEVDLDDLKPSPHVLQALHEAHMLAVPFENLSIHYGQPIVLRDEALYEKIVWRHRGGFCYELNGLFAWLLRSLGFEVSLLAAGVAQSNGGYTPEFDHLTLLVHREDGADWLADVGFGDSFRRPLRFQADVEQDAADGHRYRLRADDSGYWTVEQRADEQWQPQYRFTLQPHVLADFEERCRYQQTSPESHFTQKRICSLALPEGRVSLSDFRLITTRQGKRAEREVESDEEYRAILAKTFGIVL